MLQIVQVALADLHIRSHLLLCQAVYLAVVDCLFGEFLLVRNIAGSQTVGTWNFAHMGTITQKCVTGKRKV